MENRIHSENNTHNDNSSEGSSVEECSNINQERAEKSTDEINFDLPILEKRHETSERIIKDQQILTIKERQIRKLPTIIYKMLVCLDNK